MTKSPAVAPSTEALAISIAEPANLSLFQHLVEAGRINGRSVHDIRTLLHQGVAHYWGTPATQVFSDSSGAGWIVDLSDVLDGEEMYAVIRTLRGQRFVADVVDVDAFEAFQQNGRWQSADARGEHAAPPAAPLPSPPVKKPAAPDAGSDPNREVLIAWRNPNTDRELDDRVYQRCKHGDIQAVVWDLISKQGASAETIEIWTDVRKPKVQIQF